MRRDFYEGELEGHGHLALISSIGHNDGTLYIRSCQVDYSELYRRPFQSVGPAFQASAPITGAGTLYGQPAPIS